MSTTIDMPPALMRAATARAAEEGESLDDLVNRAVARETGLPAMPKGKAGRVTLPLIARDATPAVLVPMTTSPTASMPNMGRFPRSTWRRLGARGRMKSSDRASRDSAIPAGARTSWRRR